MADDGAKRRGPDEIARARLRLGARAERAFGVKAIAGVTVPEIRRVLQPGLRSATAAPGAPQAPQRTSPPAAPARPAGRTSAAVDLFGNPVAISPEMAGGIGEVFSDPPLPRAERMERLRVLDETEVTGCTKCPLHEGRTRTVFGEGDPEARLMFIGEGPGENEDLSGRPFVGRAGGLLDKMIVGMGLKREQVYIANVVKCRPPNNRVPTAVEVATCTPYLHQQIDWIRPKVIVTLGLPATRHLLKSNSPMGKLRGQWHEWRGIKVMPTYHPAYLLRSYTEANRRVVWGDLQAVMTELGLRTSGGKRGEK